MTYEVLVVGGGVGGLTVSALLAARGLSVCLFERQSQVGGCLADVEHLGYRFEPTSGMYSGWEPGGTFARIFSELPAQLPRADRLSPAYVVRLPDQTEVTMSEDIRRFEHELQTAFPECANAALEFYRQLPQLAHADSDRSIAAPLRSCSQRFRRFIDIQLQTFTQQTSEACLQRLGAMALLAPWRGLWTIRGGAQSLTDALAESIKASGGTVKLNAPVLRLAYGSDGQPIGVDMLSGERVTATKAIISNLTVWDTYGKLFGPSRTPRQVSSVLKNLSSWGAYLVFLGMEETAAARLRSHRVMALTDWQTDSEFSPEGSQFVLAVKSAAGHAPEGKLAATVTTFTNADDWFSFHEDATAHEEQDQSQLEKVWSQLHAALPELGDEVEIIETATPQTFYETTRRRLGMVGGLSTSISDDREPLWRTVFPNVFIVGDTVANGFGVEGVVRTAASLADAMTNTFQVEK